MPCEAILFLYIDTYTGNYMVTSGNSQIFQYFVWLDKEEEFLEYFLFIYTLFLRNIDRNDIFWPLILTLLLTRP